MKIENKQLRRSTQSWISRVDRRQPPKIEYNSELEDWVKHVILTAEKRKDFKKKEEFIKLLRDLNAA
ncbi:MAG: hypothetical protein ACLFU9_02630 [Candidatus Bathyarchaeia archaeon]